jgi:hypothetical protein
MTQAHDWVAYGKRGGLERARRLSRRARQDIAPYPPSPLGVSRRWIHERTGGARSPATDLEQLCGSIRRRSAPGRSSSITLRGKANVGIVKRGANYCIRYYGPDGRQRWETIGPNRKEAETVLHQRLYEVRSGIHPILRRRSRLTFHGHAEEWVRVYATTHVRASTRSTYRRFLDHHLLPAFGSRALTEVTASTIQTYSAEQAQRLAPRTVNHALAPPARNPRGRVRHGQAVLESGS